MAHDMGSKKNKGIKNKQKNKHEKKRKKKRKEEGNKDDEACSGILRIN